MNRRSIALASWPLLATVLVAAGCEQAGTELAAGPQPGLEAWLDADGRIDPSTVVYTPPSGAEDPVLIRIRDHTGALVEEQEFDGDIGVSQLLSYLSPEESAKVAAAMGGVASLLAAEGISEDQIRSAVESLTAGMSPEDQATMSRAMEEVVK